MTNFKTEKFQGTLKELLDECNPHLSDSKVIDAFNEAHAWLINQFDNVDNNIIPIRKYKNYKNRGEIVSIENSTSSFMPVDNEPFCFFYEKWMAKESYKESLKVLFQSKKVPASWNCDTQNKNGMKFSGVSTAFRDNGLKLAHINDAGVLEDILQASKRNNAIRTRFLRSLSPLNVFLFPNYRCSNIVSSTYNSSVKDWAEDKKIRQIALSYLISKLNISQDLLDVFLPQLNYLDNWEALAKSIHIVVVPKSITRAKKSNVIKIEKEKERKSKSQISKNEISQDSLQTIPCPKTTKNSTIDDMIIVYKEWRRKHPETYRLDGKSKGNPGGTSPWLHFFVEGYSENESFTSQHGPIFSGADYSGNVNFHGDTPCEKMDEFIELYEIADSYKDILRQSATYEFKSLPEGKTVSPKFALKGYQDGVSKFYAYHDEWSSRQKKAS